MGDNMVWHEFGDRCNSVILLIHGVLTPWQIWQEVIDHYSHDHLVVVPELDAHTEDEVSRFISVEDEAEKIVSYIRDNFDGHLYMLCGLSMGGRIAAAVMGMPGIKVQRLVLDGAPLEPVPKLLVRIMTNNYIRIISRSKERDPKVIESFKRDFLPAKHLENYLKIADNMDEESIRNMLGSVFVKHEFTKYPGEMKILFMHGTKGNEKVSAKGAAAMKEVNPQTEIRRFDGYAHAQLLCFEPSKWIEEVDRWVRAGQ